MELKAGIEPATSPLPRVCSTTEPLELTCSFQTYSTLSILLHVGSKTLTLSARIITETEKMERETGFEPVTLSLEN